jgi:hypothetical protein
MSSPILIHRPQTFLCQLAPRITDDYRRRKPSYLLCTECWPRKCTKLFEDVASSRVFVSISVLPSFSSVLPLNIVTVDRQFDAMCTPNLKTVHIFSIFGSEMASSIMFLLSGLHAPRLRHISFMLTVIHQSVEEITWGGWLELDRFLHDQASRLICELDVLLPVSVQRHTSFHQKFAETFPFTHSRQKLQFVVEKASSKGD